MRLNSPNHGETKNAREGIDAETSEIFVDLGGLFVWRNNGRPPQIERAQSHKVKRSFGTGLDRSRGKQGRRGGGSGGSDGHNLTGSRVHSGRD